jgi:hypothetical protein
VCCVKFSADGKYLATGCNRAAQIFDAKTGAKTWCVHFDLPHLLTLSLFMQQCTRG